MNLKLEMKSVSVDEPKHIQQTDHGSQVKRIRNTERREGKDQVIFATKEDLDTPSTAIVNMEEDEEDQQPGLILPNGDINWDCPCLGGMASGPCGMQFRNAFSCFHYSKAEPKGSDCYEAFLTMQECMTQYPELYPPAKAPASEELSQLSSTQDDVGMVELKGMGSKLDSDMANEATHVES